MNREDLDPRLSTGIDDFKHLLLIFSSIYSEVFEKALDRIWFLNLCEKCQIKTNGTINRRNYSNKITQLSETLDMLLRREPFLKD